MSTRYNFFGGLVTDGMVLNVDVAKLQSYSGSGTNWLNLINNSISGGTLINGPSITGSGKNLAIRFDGSDDYVNFGNIFKSWSFIMSNTFVLTSQEIENPFCLLIFFIIRKRIIGVFYNLLSS